MIMDVANVIAFKTKGGVVPVFIAQDVRAVVQGNGLFSNYQIRYTFEHMHV